MPSRLGNRLAEKLLHGASSSSAGASTATAVAWHAKGQLGNSPEA